VSAELVRAAREVQRNAYCPYSKFRVGAALEAAVVVSDAEPPASPCGACRQLLAEFGLGLEVIAVGPKSERRWTLSALLPDAFAKASLER